MKTINGKELQNKLEVAMRLKADNTVGLYCGEKIGVVKTNYDELIYVGTDGTDLNDYTFISVDNAKKAAKFLKSIGNKKHFDMLYDVEGNMMVLSDICEKKKVKFEIVDKSEYFINEYSRLGKAEECGRLLKSELVMAVSLVNFTDAKSTNETWRYIYADNYSMYATDARRARRILLKNMANNLFVPYNAIEFLDKAESDVVFYRNKDRYFMKYDDVVMSYVCDEKKQYPNMSSLFDKDSLYSAEIKDGKSFINDLKFLEDYAEKENGAKKVDIDFMNGKIKTTSSTVSAETDMEDYLVGRFDLSILFDVKLISSMFDICNKATFNATTRLGVIEVRYDDERITDVYCPCRRME